MPKETVSTSLVRLAGGWTQTEELLIGWDSGDDKVDLRLDRHPFALRFPPEGPMERPEAGSSVAISLTRPQINALIRKLRIVRDRVFGPDA